MIKFNIFVSLILSAGFVSIAQDHFIDKTGDQLQNFSKNKTIPDNMTTSWGAPVSSKSAVLTVGPLGPILLQDVVYLDEMSHFVRERIPERVVHGKGSGAHGEFVVTHNITQFTRAKLFSVGKKTQCFVRFSTVAGEMGNADTVRDVRGFAIKFYTEEGNWDLVGINQPIFFIRDPMLLPSLVHAQKRNPVTNLRDPNMVWDFFSQQPETIHMIMHTFSDLGIPDGYRKMDGFGSHTFKLVNDKGQISYCKFHLKSQQGVHNLTTERAMNLSATDPDYAQRDLYNAIENSAFPKWNLSIQVMTLEEFEDSTFNPFDVTQVWPEHQYKLNPVGILTLNRNPTNYFEEVEQAAFAPSRMVPGIEVSPDKLLQGRLFAYPDAQYHRLGANFMKLPINNCPFHNRVNNTQINGNMRFDGNEGGAPIYFPNTFHGPIITGMRESNWTMKQDEEFTRFGTDYYGLDFYQPQLLWKYGFDEEAKKRLVENIANSLGGALPRIQKTMLDHFSYVNVTFNQKLKATLCNINMAKNQSVDWCR